MMAVGPIHQEDFHTFSLGASSDPEGNVVRQTRLLLFNDRNNLGRMFIERLTKRLFYATLIYDASPRLQSIAEGGEDPNEAAATKLLSPVDDTLNENGNDVTNQTMETGTEAGGEGGEGGDDAAKEPGHAADEADPNGVEEGEGGEEGGAGNGNSLVPLNPNKISE